MDGNLDLRSEMFKELMEVITTAPSVEGHKSAISLRRLCSSATNEAQTLDNIFLRLVASPKHQSPTQNANSREPKFAIVERNMESTHDQIWPGPCIRGGGIAQARIFDPSISPLGCLRAGA